MNDFPLNNEQIAMLATSDFGMMSAIPVFNTYSITLTHDQISELERLVRIYTDALAMYNTLGPGKQMTLDILNEVYDQIHAAAHG